MRSVNGGIAEAEVGASMDETVLGTTVAVGDGMVDPAFTKLR